MKHFQFFTHLMFAAAIACMIMTTSSCQNSNKSATRQEVTANDTALTQIDTEVLDAVKAAYTAATKAYSGNNDQMVDLDSIYCSTDWNNTVKKINEKDMASDDIGFFEADYWVMGQDAGDYYADNFKIVPSDSNDPHHTSVDLDLHNLGNITKVRLEMVKEENSWKIDNFIDQTNNMNWKKQMIDYLSE